MLTIEFGEFPVLRTRRLTLRQVEPADSAAFFRLRSDPEVMRYLDRPLAQSEDEVRDLIDKIRENYRNNEAILWAISLQNDPSFIGNVCFWRIDKENHRAEAGYMLSPDFQNQGMMGEALRAALEYGFGALKFHSVEANVNPENAASIRLLEKTGFVREAYFRENYHYNNKFLDSAIYSLLVKDFK